MASEKYYSDIDPIETQEWLDSFSSLIEKEGPDRAKHILKVLIEKARTSSVSIPSLTTAYVNTIPPDREAHMPGDVFMERKIRSLIRWNAI